MERIDFYVTFHGLYLDFTPKKVSRSSFMMKSFPHLTDYYVKLRTNRGQRKRNLVKTNSFCHGINNTVTDTEQKHRAIQSYLQRKYNSNQMQYGKGNQRQTDYNMMRPVVSLRRSLSTVSDVHGLYQNNLNE